MRHRAGSDGTFTTRLAEEPPYATSTWCLRLTTLERNNLAEAQTVTVAVLGEKMHRPVEAKENIEPVSKS